MARNRIRKSTWFATAVMATPVAAIYNGDIDPDLEARQLGVRGLYLKAGQAGSGGAASPSHISGWDSRVWARFGCEAAQSALYRPRCAAPK